MPYIYADVDSLQSGTTPVVGTGECTDLIKHFVPGLIGLPTTAWRAGVNVTDPKAAIAKGTAIATFVDGRYPRLAHGNHAAIVVKVTPMAIQVVDQWRDPAKRPYIMLRDIRVPPRWLQKNPDGSFRQPSDNALAFFVIEK